MATLEAAQEYFDLLEGASDADYNAYNYMVLTAQSKPHARDKIPAVIHADGTGRVQIVRAEDDPLTYAYLKALGRHIGVEISVNTSFNVAGPDRADPAAGDRYAAPLQRPRRRAAGGERWRGHRRHGMAANATAGGSPSGFQNGTQNAVSSRGHRATLSNCDRASKELKHSSVDDQQSTADHNGANDLAERNRLSQHQISE